MNKLYLLFIVILFACGSGKSSEEAPSEKYVYFISPKDGDVITSPFKVEMGVKGMQVEPAGEVIEGCGHHHLVIDGDFIAKGTVVPADSTHIHYGKGQTVTGDISLKPGKHTLTLQFADGFHVSYGEGLSKTIEITIPE